MSKYTIGGALDYARSMADAAAGEIPKTESALQDILRAYLTALIEQERKDARMETARECAAECEIFADSNQPYLHRRGALACAEVIRDHFKLEKT